MRFRKGRTLINQVRVRLGLAPLKRVRLGTPLHPGDCAIARALQRVAPGIVVGGDMIKSESDRFLIICSQEWDMPLLYNDEGDIIGVETPPEFRSIIVTNDATIIRRMFHKALKIEAKV